ncbi:MAG: YadA C-terminal domain-containing protein, partial [Phascolarctobacterium succinatutens]|nr:YadA C-terminal domain-containing protein [Phascolarctobacterium succinatutens]
YALGGLASGKQSVSIGAGSVAKYDNVVSVGMGEDTEWWNSLPAYRRIVNMADGIANHDAATFGQIIKKDTYTISLDDTGNGNVVLKTNADKEGPTIKVDASALDTQIKQNASDITAVNGKIGTLSADGTYIKKAKNVSENLVALDNQVKRNADDISIANSTIYNVSSKIGTKYDGNYIHAVNPIGSDLVALDKQVKVNADAIGTLTSLTTTEKTNLVGAVNEVKGTADTALGLANTNKASIGTLTNLATTEKGNLVGAVNEVKGTADAAQTKANDAFTQANTNKASIGTLTNLTTTEKGNLVGAVNEVKGSVDAANTAIAGKADLGLSNINADGKIVIKNLAKTEAGAIVNVQLGDLSTEKYYVDAGKKVNENISALDKQVKTNADAIDLKANQELSNINATGENKIKTIAGVVVEGKLGTLTSSNYVDAANTVNVNISALDVQVKDNADKITTVDNKIGSLSADGKYIKKAKNVSANLVELDKQVNTNATALTNKANLDLSNINAAGKDVIINLAGNKAGEVLDVKLGAITSTHYVNAGNTVNANISALDTQLNKVENKVGTMTDGNYISAGNTVAGNLSALDAQLKNNTDAIADKADKNLSNITDAGKDVIRDLANEKAGELVDSKLGTITSENYVNAGNTVNANISKLDEQVKANADAINTKADKDLSNITDAGKNVIKDLASVKAGEVVDAKLGDITSNNYVNAGNTVNANISALDKQMKVNTDNIGDTGKLTTAGLGSNLSDAVVNVNNKVGTADELKALKDAGLGDNLAQATAAVNKKADKNAEDIKTVNGRVDELGGRVDTLGGAVSKLDTKVNKVGAGAAALAALHPMDFDSDNKLTFAAGVGSYHGASAAAIGAFYRPSEQVMFSISGNMGNGENMVNAGVSFALDRPSKTPTTKTALVKTVVAQNEQIAALSETVAEQNEKIARLEAMVEKLATKQNA